ncbi:glycosyltransferase family 39 protein [Ancylobacter sp. FA202]|uniref:ArnT family glycosyltransferase n=1 Tax=Ancylobacter sp. FA202 TaxID=1111106 RepID=UPI000377E20A|nr:glycosyltransferase family 39 protein [Ancylobacter sp. FA202]
MSLASSGLRAAQPSALRWRSLPLVRLASLAVFAAVAAFMVLTFRDYGISNDEPVQHAYGQLLLAWYASGFTDDRAFHYINLYLYGGLFDLIAAGLEPYVPLPLYEWRHLLSAGFGFVGLIGTWRLARRLGGEGAGVVAVLLLAFTGMYGGAMFTHTKDVPFAAAMVWSLYFITALAGELPALPRGRTVLGLGLSVGCALGLRVGGVFAVLYLVLTIGAAMVLLRDMRLPLRLLPRLSIAGLAALALMAATWPWSVLPPTNLFKAMGAFSHFSFDLKTLFNGQLLPIDQLPPTYMPEYLLIKLPEVTLLGLMAALVLAVLALVNRLRAPHAWIGLSPQHLLLAVPLALAILVPVAVAVLTDPPLYNGIRHFLFVLPPVTVLASLGLVGAFRMLSQRVRLAGAGFALAALGLFLFNASVLWRLHPYEYVAYNQIVGGTSGAWGRFEGDYWSSSLREAALALRHGVEREAPPAHPYKVSVCAEDVQALTYLGSRFEAVEDWEDADFILTARHVGCDAAPGLPYATVNRLGLAFASVRDQRLRHMPVEVPDRDDDGPDLDAPEVAQSGGGSPQGTGPQVAKARP